MVRTAAFATLALAALAVPALAQPGPDTEPPPPAPYVPAPPAPTTNDWSEVSHINGSLVKVGERDDYLVKNPKRVNISTNPIGFLVGFYGLSIQAAVSDNVTIRGNVEFFDYEFLGRTKGHELALSAPIYFRRSFSGPFIEPGILYQETDEWGWDLFGDGPGEPTHHTHLGPEILFGWHWTFDSGLNMAVAFGATRNMSSDRMDSDSEYDDNDDPLPTGYLRIGYAF
ncbi:MAG: hypothetical protein JNL83_08175 [Myxococcales bacterium]|nr:hypothetical protein [Myxococcales bacterium]